MKKTVQQQARRQRALDRFKTKPARHDDAEYMARKNVELEALKRALGV
jgi:hypothetical protein